MIVYGNDGKKVFCKEGTYEIIDSFNDVVKVKDSNGTYTVKLVYNEGHDVIPDWVQGSGKPPVPPIEPMTLRFAFSNPNTDPNNSPYHGQYGMADFKKIGSYMGYDNVWEITYNSEDWTVLFSAYFDAYDQWDSWLTDDLDPDIRLIEAGDLSDVKYCYAFLGHSTGLTHTCDIDLPNVINDYNKYPGQHFFDGCSNLVEIGNLSISTERANDMFKGCIKLEKIGNISLPNASYVDNLLSDCEKLSETGNINIYKVYDMGTVFNSNAPLTDVGTITYNTSDPEANTHCSAEIFLPNIVNFGGFPDYHISLNSVAEEKGNPITIGGANLTAESIHNIVMQAGNATGGFSVIRVNTSALERWRASEFYATDTAIAEQKNWLVTDQTSKPMPPAPPDHEH